MTILTSKDGATFQEFKEQKEKFLVFTRVLMKYLEQKAPEKQKEVKAIIKDCAQRNKRREPGYESVVASMEHRIRTAVSESHWKRAEAYLEHFLQQKHKSSFKSKSAQEFAARKEQQELERMRQIQQPPSSRSHQGSSSQNAPSIGLQRDIAKKRQVLGCVAASMEHNNAARRKPVTTHIQAPGQTDRRSPGDPFEPTPFSKIIERQQQAARVPVSSAPNGSSANYPSSKATVSSQASSSSGSTTLPASDAAADLAAREREMKKRKERFLVFTRVLMKYLEQKDPEKQKEVKAIIKDCAKRNKRQEPGYESVVASMEHRIRTTVSESHWKCAEAYLEHFLQQKHKSGFESKSAHEILARKKQQELDRMRQIQTRKAAAEAQQPLNKMETAACKKQELEKTLIPSCDDDSKRRKLHRTEESPFTKLGTTQQHQGATFPFVTDSTGDGNNKHAYDDRMSHRIMPPLTDDREHIPSSQRTREEHAMEESIHGKAWKFVEQVLAEHDKLQKSWSSTMNSQQHLATHLSTVAVDEMFDCAVKLFQQQASFQNAGVDTHVDIAYHYTSSRYISSIGQEGLLTKAERDERRTIRSLSRYGMFGDGIYTADGPDAFQHFGDVGILVARLKGQTKRVVNEPSKEMRRKSFNTIIANKRMNADFFRLVRQDGGWKFPSDIGKLLQELLERNDLLQFDEVVVQSSSQCLALIRYNKVVRQSEQGKELILQYHLMLQKVMDRFFNINGLATAVRTRKDHPWLLQPTFPQIAGQQPIVVELIPSATSIAASAAQGAALMAASEQCRQPAACCMPGASRSCLEVLKGLQTHQHGWVFNCPVDPVEIGLPDYFEIIKKPMDLGTIQKRLETGHYYHSIESFQADVKLTFDNAMLYNENGSVVYEMAKELKSKFETDMKKLMAQLEAEDIQRYQKQSMLPDPLARLGSYHSGQGNQVASALSDTQASSFESLQGQSKLAMTTMTTSAPSVSFTVTVPAGSVGLEISSERGNCMVAKVHNPALQRLVCEGDFLQAVDGVPLKQFDLKGWSAVIEQNASRARELKFYQLQVNQQPSWMTSRSASACGCRVFPRSQVTATAVLKPPPDPVPQITTLKYQAPETLQPPDAESTFVRISVYKGSSDEACSLCLDALRKSRTHIVRLLTCGHMFHKSCILQGFAVDPRCPICRKVIVKSQGKMPSGTMSVSLSPTVKCSGYEDCGSIVIRYNIPSDKQKTYHDHPNRQHGAAYQMAYLPDNEDGQMLLKRLKYAFRHGLTFTVGRSLSRRRDDCVCWSSIHHKTSPNSGVHGFPDPGYFVNCNEDLDALGVPKARDCPYYPETNERIRIV